MPGRFKSMWPPPWPLPLWIRSALWIIGTASLVRSESLLSLL